MTSGLFPRLLLWTMAFFAPLSPGFSIAEADTGILSDAEWRDDIETVATSSSLIAAKSHRIEIFSLLCSPSCK
jgi:hypothetical protein